MYSQPKPFSSAESTDAKLVVDSFRITIHQQELQIQKQKMDSMLLTTLSTALLIILCVVIFVFWLQRRYRRLVLSQQAIIKEQSARLKALSEPEHAQAKDGLTETIVESNVRKRSQYLQSEVNNVIEEDMQPLVRLESAVSISKEDRDWIQQLEALVHSKLSDSHLTAETLAESMTMSRAQFFRKIKNLTGLTPAQYIDEARYQYALQLVNCKKVSSVKALAYETGFRQVEHFSRQFRQRFGKYPSEYINE